MSKSIKKLMQQKGTSEADIDKKLAKLSKNDTLMTINMLYSKQVPSDFRRKYLIRISELFNINELSSKWGAHKGTIYRTFIENDVGIFEGKNLLELELNALLNKANASKKEIRSRFYELFSKYKLDSILTAYGIECNELEYLGHLFGVNVKSYYESPSENRTKIDLPNDYSLIKPTDGIGLGVERNMAIKTTVDIKTGLVESVEQTVPSISKQDYAELAKAEKERKEFYKTPMSIITFLNLSEKERKERLEILDSYKLNADEIEKILGICSGDYYRKIKARHMIFDFNSKDKLKAHLEKLNSFEECQKFILDIIKEKRSFTDYKVNEERFIRFAEQYFDISYSRRQEEWNMPDWDEFCKRLIEQTIRVHKKNSRVTNLTEAEVLEYEKANRKVIPDKDLIRITRIVIKEIHDDNQNWISIYDFKTAIEKEGFELDSNDRLIATVDRLIDRNSFSNDFFTLKKINLENPILSDDSSIRWEFVTIKKPEPAKTQKISETKPDAIESLRKKFEDSTTLLANNSGKKDFLNSSTLEFSFNESNIDDVVDFIRQNFEMFGSGSAAITISKEN